MVWLITNLPMSEDWNGSFCAKFTGQGLKIAAWIGNHMIGRVWLPSEMRPRMAGGADDRLILPISWLKETGGQLSLLLEGVGQDGELNEVKFFSDR